jgi:hypothetical protein
MLSLGLAIWIASWGGAPTVDDLIGAYLDSGRMYESCEFRLTFLETHEGASPLAGITTSEGTYHVRRDSGRWRIASQETIRRFNSQKQLKETRKAFETVVTSPTYILVGLQGQGPKVEYVAAHLDGRPESEGVLTTGYFTLLFGFVPGNGKTPFLDVLRQSTLSVHSDATLGEPTWRLESHGPYGKARIWFDPAWGMQVRRFAFEKSGADLLNAKKVSDLPEAKPNSFGPGGRVQRFERTLDVTRMERAGDVYFPADCVIKTATEYAGGKRTAVRYAMHIDQFRPGGVFADDAFAITTPIPDGFRVQVRDRPNIEFEWRGGQIAKVVNAATERNLSSSRFAGTSFFPIGYFILFAVALLAAIGVGGFAYRRWRADT